MQETLVQFLGWEDPLEEGMATHSSQYSCLENPYGQGSLVGYSLWGRTESDITEVTPSPRAWRPDVPGAAREAP